jgi:hypothetical protein
MDTPEAECPTNAEVLAAMPTFRAAWLMSYKSPAEMQEIAATLTPAQLQEMIASITTAADFLAGLATILVYAGKALADAEQRCDRVLEKLATQH